MPTRRASAQSSELHQHRFFSAPEFVEQRALNGVAVCQRARLIDDPRLRRLVWYLFSKSLNPGLPAFASEILLEYPDRIGTPAMHKQRVVPGGKYDRCLLYEVERELEPRSPIEDVRFLDEAKCLAERHGGWPQDDASAHDIEFARDYVARFARKGSGQFVTGDNLLASCLLHAQKLPRTLAALCLDPSIEIAGFQVPYFRDLIGAIEDRIERQAAQARTAFALTSVGRVVWQELDRALESGRPVMLKGETGVGKSEACTAWLKMNEGRAIRICLTAICNRTTFFQSLADALGIASALTRSASKLEIRVREVLQRSGLLLIVEEFHYAFSRVKRPTAPPEIPDWIYSALIDAGVPVALVATPQVSQLVAHAEDRTGWNARQWLRRVRRSVDLPSEPTREDLDLVAANLFPGACAKMLKIAVAFSGRFREPFDALRDLADEALFVARSEGRSNLTARDLVAAIAEVEGVYRAKAPAPPVTRPRRISRTGPSAGPQFRPSDTGAGLAPDGGRDPAEAPPKETLCQAVVT